MSLREDRKKMQRTVLYWVENCPADKVLPELLKLKQTVDSQITLLTPETDHASSSPSSDTNGKASIAVEEVAVSNLLVEAEVC